MFITYKPTDILRFTAVEYAVFDSEGNVHIGFTIKTYLKHHHITYDEFSRQLSMSLTGVSSMVSRSTIDTGRLLQISKCLKHDFFKYFSINIHNNILSEPETPYETKKEKPTNKLVLEIENNKVVSQRVDEGEDKSVAEMLKEMERRQEDLFNELLKHVPGMRKPD